ncbi:hypothetical protein SAMN05421770_11620 [Granulicella rosea]|uniref:Uncharacterized protein n=1 Tax=Granulicella rosea TaxID=474952 RepID=A0A239MLT6_9BACT|nr:hypothetical protein SAMN05421770_11620 [Granulicella rosea]
MTESMRLRDTLRLVFPAATPLLCAEDLLGQSE